MRFRALCLLLLALAVTPTLFADGTIRYVVNIKYGPLVATAAAVSPTPIEVKPPAPGATTIQWKNGKMHIASDPAFLDKTFDYKTMQFTLLDPKHKLFSTTSMKEFTGQISPMLASLPPIPPMVGTALESMKTTFLTRALGSKEVIQGIDTEETEMTLSLTMPWPAALPIPGGSLQPGQPTVVVSVVMHIWDATPAEIERVPAIKEFAALHSGISSNADFTTGIFAVQKLFTSSKYPGLGDGLIPMIEEFLKHRSLILRTDMEVYLPVLAQLSPMMKAQHMPDFDPNAPVVTVDMNAVEISSAPIADSVFAVPSDYHATAIADLIDAAIPTPEPKMSSPISTKPGSGAPSHRRLGGANPISIASKPLDASDVAWLGAYTGQQSHAVTIDHQFAQLIEDTAPDATYHLGMDMPLAQAFSQIIAGPSFPVQMRDGRYLLLAARRSTSGRGGGFLWIDMQQPLAYGGIFLYPSNGEPTPTLTIFSKQVSDKTPTEAELPGEFLKDMGSWNTEMNVPAATTRYFIGASGLKTVFMHGEDACKQANAMAAGSAGLCQAMNQDAAETDMEAAYYLLGTHFLAGSAPRTNLEVDQQHWLTQRDAACGQGPSTRECRIKMTRDRGEELNKQITSQ